MAPRLRPWSGPGRSRSWSRAGSGRAAESGSSRSSRPAPGRRCRQRSIARTWKLCWPAARPCRCAASRSLSMRPRRACTRRQFGPGVVSSLPLKRKVADVAVVTAGGPDAMRVSGARAPAPSSSGTSSTAQSCVAGVMSFRSAKSVARTSKWCVPSSRSLNVTGLMHSTQPSPSGGVSMSGGSPGFGGSRSGSCGSGSGSGSGSRRHSNSIAVGGEKAAPSGVWSLAVNSNVTSPPETAPGCSRDDGDRRRHVRRDERRCRARVANNPHTLLGLGVAARLVSAAVDVGARERVTRDLRVLAGVDAKAGVVVRLVARGPCARRRRPGCRSRRSGPSCCSGSARRRPGGRGR